ncbi:MAG: sugar phosphate isomerase/epimerase family protein [Gemmataceae bacterium]
MTPLSRRSFLAAAAALPVARGTIAAPVARRPAAKFKLGLVTYNVPANWDLPTVLATCKEVGIAAVECRTTHKHGVEPSLSADDRRRVKGMFADAGVVFWGCGSVCEFHSAYKAVVAKNVEECKRFVGLVKDLGGTGVKVRPNGVAKGMTPEQACEQIGQALKLCGAAAADAGVEIWVEVHGGVTQLPANMKRIMDTCGHPAVGVTWNSNPTDLVNGSLDAGFDLLAKHIKSCHINDLDNPKYPYRALFQRLAGIGYDRYTLCEVGKSYPPEEGKRFLKQYKAKWEELVGA